MENPFSLKGKKVIITGASSGIGKESAVRIAAMGAETIITGRNKERLEKTYKEIKKVSGKDHKIIPADLSTDEQIDILVKKLPEIDGIFHSIGIIKPYPVQFIAEKQINEMFVINYYAPVLLTSKMLRAKKINAGGSIVFMSSISSTFSHKGGALYAGSKAALNAYSKTIAIELGQKKIRSNCIQAAMVKTPLFEKAEETITKEMMDKHGDQYPLGFGEPEDIANAVVFLLSDASKWITGTNLVMDGGLTAG